MITKFNPTGLEAWRYGDQSGVRIRHSSPGVHHSHSHFKYNEYGHIVVTLMGLSLTGSQEIARLGGAEIRILRDAKSCLLSEGSGGYDAMHRLVAKREYKVAFMPGVEIGDDSKRTTENLRRLGMDRYRYKKPLAGLVPRILEKVSLPRLFQEKEYRYIAALHDPIDCGGGKLRVLDTGRVVQNRELGASSGGPYDLWDSRGCFAFEVV